jgi:hypothetical protein
LATRTPYTGTAASGDIFTAARLNEIGPGVIGYAQVTADQTGITTAVDLTGLTLTLTPAASRIIVIEWHVEVQITASSSGDIFNVLLLKDGTQKAVTGMPFNVSSEIATLSGVYVDVAPTNASHTYKLQGARQAGTGTYKVRGSATETSTLLVSDMGVSF